MSRNEKQTRIQLINPALRLAGWKVLNELHIIEPGVACIETPVSGMPKTMENTTGNGFVDYVLFGKDHRHMEKLRRDAGDTDARGLDGEDLVHTLVLEQAVKLLPQLADEAGIQLLVEEGTHLQHVAVLDDTVLTDAILHQLHKKILPFCPSYMIGRRQPSFSGGNRYIIHHFLKKSKRKFRCPRKRFFVSIIII